MLKIIPFKIIFYNIYFLEPEAGPLPRPTPEGGVKSGEIRHENYGINENLEWPISTDCASVTITSSAFDTEATYDYVTIEDVQYSGTNPISVTVPSGNTVVRFHSDATATKSGFVLAWSCPGL